MSELFIKLGVNPEIQKVLNAKNILQPTEIQSQVIPLFLKQSNDIVATAKTGTGKTAAFGLPLLQLVDVQNSNIQALILAPTRELAQQIHTQLIDFGAAIDGLKVSLLTGGSSLKSQQEELNTTPQIVIATPGRLMDLMERNALSLKSVQHLVLDEADEMFQAFKEELQTITKALPQTKKSYLFSATMPSQVKDYVHNFMSKDVLTVAAEMEVKAHADIEHQYTVVEPIEKLDVLLHFLSSQEGNRGIIFCRTKAAVNKLAKNLAKRKISSGAIHGSLTQKIRDRIMEQFREGHINILVATDLVARGIDVKELAYVVNYHLPDTVENYVHRSGRTGRAGEKGLSMTILQTEEVAEIRRFEEELEIQFNVVGKADTEDLESNKMIVWANKVLKSKLDKSIPNEAKEEVRNVFNRLSKDELIDKIVSNYWKENKGKHNS
ncbi:DEAD/DEAH box helicase [Brumimicrobium aurantiacum]|uniref:DEAD/DEAH box helicase n=1 Tax=Brumimicrobium aurantiacum TaxID=1737063 RepID=A0A3E1EZT6_9FLAO|nr:DEAD/DEAH box helicase [Brumimicrobium aurantiacum]RFC55065.1 DEAD/DEAH box helicase [Brumimicrobium aurantiacum]